MFSQPNPAYAALGHDGGASDPAVIAMLRWYGDHVLADQLTGCVPVPPAGTQTRPV